MLDTLPGEVRAGEAGRKDHPADLIATLRRQQLPIGGRRQLLAALEAAGFSRHIATWVSTNLQPLSAHNGNVGVAEIAAVSSLPPVIWPFTHGNNGRFMHRYGIRSCHRGGVQPGAVKVLH